MQQQAPYTQGPLFQAPRRCAVSFHYFLFIWLCHVACGILFPWPGIEPVPPTVGVWSPNNLTTREVPHCTFRDKIIRVWRAQATYSEINEAVSETLRKWLWSMHLPLHQTTLVNYPSLHDEYMGQWMRFHEKKNKKTNHNWKLFINTWEVRRGVGHVSRWKSPSGLVDKEDPEYGWRGGQSAYR